MASSIVTYSLRTLLALMLTSSLVTSLIAAERPDFVFFIADDHGRMDSGLFGAADARTPHLDKLARDGMHLSHMFVASPSCAPSRAALFTAQYPQNNGVEANHDYERFAGVTSLVHRFVDLGYEVASFGKVAHGLYNPKEQWDHGFTHSGAQRLDLDEVEAFLKERGRDRPLLLFVGTRHPHVPWSQEELRFDPAQVSLPPPSVDTPQTRVNRAQYLEDVQKMDDHLGATRKLVRRYLGRNTFFLFSSDHGAQWPFAKWNLYEDSVRVATVAAWPGRIPAGSESDALLSWIDILPTLLDLAGGEADTQRDGRSFAPVLLDGQTTHRARIFASHTGDGGNINVYPMRMVRDRDWLYVRNLHPEFRFSTHMDKNNDKPHNLFWDTWEAAANTDPEAAAVVDAYRRRPAEELFYLAEDPHTQNNLAGNLAHRGVLATLRAEVHGYMARTSDRRLVSGEAAVLEEPLPPKSGPRITTGESQLLLDHDRQLELGIRFIDSGLPMVMIDGEPAWFATRHDRPGNDEGQMLFTGPREDPFARVVATDIRIDGLPERRPEFVGPGNAAWIGNVYRDPGSGHILAFLHLEYWPFGMERKKYNRIGLAISEDGGRTFDWCGYIVTPDLPYERWLNHWYPEAPGTNNVGWASYIIRDGWFMVYYQDTEDRPDRAVNGLAVARAPVADVLAAAAQRRVTPWMKFHDGQFSEPGLGGRFTSLMEPRGYMHGDAAWNEYLQQYLLVVRDGKHTESSGALLISFSEDGLAWTPWQDIRRNRHLHDYPVIVSDGPDNEVTGQSFWVYYKYDPDDLMPEKYGAMQLERLRVTLQKPVPLPEGPVIGRVDPVMSRAEIEAGLARHDRALFIKDDWIRDPYIVLGPDDYFYLTGTTMRPGDKREHTNPYNPGLGGETAVGDVVRIWRSRDLVDWEYLGEPYSLEDSWHEEPGKVIWAPEVHWIPELQRWALVHCPGRKANLALSAGADIRGPWTHPMGELLGNRHDPSLFRDGDTWWLLWGNTQIASLNEDFSRYTADPVRIDPSGSRLDSQGRTISRIGHEGATIRKIGDKYVHFGTAWSTDDMRRGSYNLYYSTADRIDGPYGPRRFAGRFLGHGTPFQDRDGKWWTTAFFNANVPPLPREGIQERDLSETAQTINGRGTTIVPLEVRIEDGGDIYIRARDPAYANPGPDENQDFQEE